LDSDIAQLFLNELAEAQAPASKQIIQSWDGALAHRAKRLLASPRITIMGTLPYTPECNPMENFWLPAKERAAND
jgi:hypothetical protein